MVECGEETFGVQGCRAAGTGGSDGLPVGVVDQVAAGEDAVDVGPGARRVDEHVPGVVEVDLAGEQLRARVVPDRDEQAGGLEQASLAGRGVAQHDPAQLVLADQGLDLGVPDELDLGVLEGTVLHDLACPERVTAVHQGDFACEPGQERRLLDGGVAAADHDDVLIAEEEAVAGRAPADAVAGEPVLAGDVEPAVARSRGQQDRACPVPPTGAVGDHLDRTRQLDGGDVVGDQLGAETLGLGAEAVHQRRAHDSVGKAGVVLHIGGIHQGATGGDRALEHQRPQLGPGRVERRGIAGRARPDDDHVAHVLGHIVPFVGRSSLAGHVTIPTDPRCRTFLTRSVRMAASTPSPMMPEASTGASQVSTVHPPYTGDERHADDSHRDAVAIRASVSMSGVGSRCGDPCCAGCGVRRVWPRRQDCR